MYLSSNSLKPSVTLLVSTRFIGCAICSHGNNSCLSPLRQKDLSGLASVVETFEAYSGRADIVTRSGERVSIDGHKFKADEGNFEVTTSNVDLFRDSLESVESKEIKEINYGATKLEAYESEFLESVTGKLPSKRALTDSKSVVYYNETETGETGNLQQVELDDFSTNNWKEIDLTTHSSDNVAFSSIVHYNGSQVLMESGSSRSHEFPIEFPEGDLTTSGILGENIIKDQVVSNILTEPDQRIQGLHVSDTENILSLRTESGSEDKTVAKTYEESIISASQLSDKDLQIVNSDVGGTSQGLPLDQEFLTSYTSEVMSPELEAVGLKGFSEKRYELEKEPDGQDSSLTKTSIKEELSESDNFSVIKSTDEDESEKEHGDFGSPEIKVEEIDNLQSANEAITKEAPGKQYTEDTEIWNLEVLEQGSDTDSFSLSGLDQFTSHEVMTSNTETVYKHTSVDSIELKDKEFKKPESSDILDLDFNDELMLTSDVDERHQFEESSNDQSKENTRSSSAADSPHLRDSDQTRPEENFGNVVSLEEKEERELKMTDSRVEPIFQIEQSDKQRRLESAISDSKASKDEMPEYQGLTSSKPTDPGEYEVMAANAESYLESEKSRKTDALEPSVFTDRTVLELIDDLEPHGMESSELQPIQKYKLIQGLSPEEDRSFHLQSSDGTQTKSVSVGYGSIEEKLKGERKEDIALSGISVTSSREPSLKNEINEYHGMSQSLPGGPSSYEVMIPYSEAASGSSFIEFDTTHESALDSEAASESDFIESGTSHESSSDSEAATELEFIKLGTYHESASDSEPMSESNLIRLGIFHERESDSEAASDSNFIKSGTSHESALDSEAASESDFIESCTSHESAFDSEAASESDFIESGTSQESASDSEAATESEFIELDTSHESAPMELESNILDTTETFFSDNQTLLPLGTNHIGWFEEKTSGDKSGQESEKDSSKLPDSSGDETQPVIQVAGEGAKTESEEDSSKLPDSSGDETQPVIQVAGEGAKTESEEDSSKLPDFSDEIQPEMQVEGEGAKTESEEDSSKLPDFSDETQPEIQVEGEGAKTESEEDSFKLPDFSDETQPEMQVAGEGVKTESEEDSSKLPDSSDETQREKQVEEVAKAESEEDSSKLPDSSDETQREKQVEEVAKTESEVDSSDETQREKQVEGERAKTESEDSSSKLPDSSDETQREKQVEVTKAESEEDSSKLPDSSDETQREKQVEELTKAEPEEDSSKLPDSSDETQREKQVEELTKAESEEGSSKLPDSSDETQREKQVEELTKAEPEEDSSKLPDSSDETQPEKQVEEVAKAESEEGSSKLPDSSDETQREKQVEEVTKAESEEGSSKLPDSSDETQREKQVEEVTKAESEEGSSKLPDSSDETQREKQVEEVTKAESEEDSSKLPDSSDETQSEKQVEEVTKAESEEDSSKLPDSSDETQSEKQVEEVTKAESEEDSSKLPDSSDETQSEKQVEEVTKAESEEDSSKLPDSSDETQSENQVEEVTKAESEEDFSKLPDSSDETQSEKQVEGERAKTESEEAFSKLPDSSDETQSEKQVEGERAKTESEDSSSKLPDSSDETQPEKQVEEVAKAESEEGSSKLPDSSDETQPEKQVEEVAKAESEEGSSKLPDSSDETQREKQFEEGTKAEFDIASVSNKEKSTNQNKGESNFSDIEFIKQENLDGQDMSESMKATFDDVIVSVNSLSKLVSPDPDVLHERNVVHSESSDVSASYMSASGEEPSLELQTLGEDFVKHPGFQIEVSEADISESELFQSQRPSDPEQAGLEYGYTKSRSQIEVSESDISESELLQSQRSSGSDQPELESSGSNKNEEVVGEIEYEIFGLNMKTSKLTYTEESKYKDLNFSKQASEYQNLPSSMHKEISSYRIVNSHSEELQGNLFDSNALHEKELEKSQLELLVAKTVSYSDSDISGFGTEKQNSLQEVSGSQIEYEPSYPLSSYAQVQPSVLSLKEEVGRGEGGKISTLSVEGESDQQYKEETQSSELHVSNQWFSELEFAAGEAKLKIESLESELGSQNSNKIDGLELESPSYQTILESNKGELCPHEQETSGEQRVKENKSLQSSESDEEPDASRSQNTLDQSPSVKPESFKEKSIEERQAVTTESDSKLLFGEASGEYPANSEISRDQGPLLSTPIELSPYVVAASSHQIILKIDLLESGALNDKVFQMQKVELPGDHNILPKLDSDEIILSETKTSEISNKNDLHEVYDAYLLEEDFAEGKSDDSRKFKEHAVATRESSDSKMIPDQDLTSLSDRDEIYNLAPTLQTAENILPEIDTPIDTCKECDVIYSEVDVSEGEDLIDSKYENTQIPEPVVNDTAAFQNATDKTFLTETPKTQVFESYKLGREGAMEKESEEVYHDPKLLENTVIRKVALELDIFTKEAVSTQRPQGTDSKDQENNGESEAILSLEFNEENSQGLQGTEDVSVEKGSLVSVKDVDLNSDQSDVEVTVNSELFLSQSSESETSLETSVQMKLDEDKDYMMKEFNNKSLSNEKQTADSQDLQTTSSTPKLTNQKLSDELNFPELKSDNANATKFLFSDEKNEEDSGTGKHYQYESNELLASHAETISPEMKLSGNEDLNQLELQETGPALFSSFSIQVSPDPGTDVEEPLKSELPDEDYARLDLEEPHSTVGLVIVDHISEEESKYSDNGELSPPNSDQTEVEANPIDENKQNFNVNHASSRDTKVFSEDDWPQESDVTTPSEIKLSTDQALAKGTPVGESTRINALDGNHSDGLDEAYDESMELLESEDEKFPNNFNEKSLQESADKNAEDIRVLIPKSVNEISPQGTILAVEELAKHERVVSEVEESNEKDVHDSGSSTLKMSDNQKSPNHSLVDLDISEIESVNENSGFVDLASENQLVENRSPSKQGHNEMKALISEFTVEIMPESKRSDLTTSDFEGTQSSEIQVENGLKHTVDTMDVQTPMYLEDSGPQPSEMYEADLEKVSLTLEDPNIASSTNFPSESSEFPSGEPFELDTDMEGSQPCETNASVQARIDSDKRCFVDSNATGQRAEYPTIDNSELQISSENIKAKTKKGFTKEDKALVKVEIKHPDSHGHAPIVKSSSVSKSHSEGIGYVRRIASSFTRLVRELNKEKVKEDNPVKSVSERLEFDTRETTNLGDQQLDTEKLEFAKESISTSSRETSTRISTANATESLVKKSNASREGERLTQTYEKNTTIPKDVENQSVKDDYKNTESAVLEVSDISSSFDGAPTTISDSQRSLLLSLGIQGSVDYEYRNELSSEGGHIDLGEDKITSEVKEVNELPDIPLETSSQMNSEMEIAQISETNSSIRADLDSNLIYSTDLCGPDQEATECLDDASKLQGNGGGIHPERSLPNEQHSSDIDYFDSIFHKQRLAEEQDKTLIKSDSKDQKSQNFTPAIKEFVGAESQDRGYVKRIAAGFNLRTTEPSKENVKDLKHITLVPEILKFDALELKQTNELENDEPKFESTVKNAAKQHEVNSTEKSMDNESRKTSVEIPGISKAKEIQPLNSNENSIMMKNVQGDYDKTDTFESREELPHISTTFEKTDDLQLELPSIQNLDSSKAGNMNLMADTINVLGSDLFSSQGSNENLNEISIYDIGKPILTELENRNLEEMQVFNLLDEAVSQTNLYAEENASSSATEVTEGTNLLENEFVVEISSDNFDNLVISGNDGFYLREPCASYIEETFVNQVIEDALTQSETVNSNVNAVPLPDIVEESEDSYQEISYSTEHDVENSKEKSGNEENEIMASFGIKKIDHELDGSKDSIAIPEMNINAIERDSNETFQEVQLDDEDSISGTDNCSGRDLTTQKKSEESEILYLNQSIGTSDIPNDAVRAELGNDEIHGIDIANVQYIDGDEMKDSSDVSEHYVQVTDMNELKFEDTGMKHIDAKDINVIGIENAPEDVVDALSITTEMISESNREETEKDYAEFANFSEDDISTEMHHANVDNLCAVEIARSDLTGAVIHDDSVEIGADIYVAADTSMYRIDSNNVNIDDEGVAEADLLDLEDIEVATVFANALDVDIIEGDRIGVMSVEVPEGVGDEETIDVSAMFADVVEVENITSGTPDIDVLGTRTPDLGRIESRFIDRVAYQRYAAKALRSEGYFTPTDTLDAESIEDSEIIFANEVDAVSNLEESIGIDAANEEKVGLELTNANDRNLLDSSRKYSDASIASEFVPSPTEVDLSQIDDPDMSYTEETALNAKHEITNSAEIAMENVFTSSEFSSDGHSSYLDDYSAVIPSVWDRRDSVSSTCSSVGKDIEDLIIAISKTAYIDVASVDPSDQIDPVSEALETNEILPPDDFQRKLSDASTSSSIVSSEARQRQKLFSYMEMIGSTDDDDEDDDDDDFTLTDTSYAGTEISMTSTEDEFERSHTLHEYIQRRKSSHTDDINNVVEMSHPLDGDDFTETSIPDIVIEYAETVHQIANEAAEIYDEEEVDLVMSDTADRTITLETSDSRSLTSTDLHNPRHGSKTEYDKDSLHVPSEDFSKIDEGKGVSKSSPDFSVINITEAVIITNSEDNSETLIGTLKYSHLNDDDNQKSSNSELDGTEPTASYQGYHVGPDESTQKITSGKSRTIGNHSKDISKESRPSTPSRLKKYLGAITEESRTPTPTGIMRYFDAITRVSRTPTPTGFRKYFGSFKRESRTPTPTRNSPAIDIELEKVSGDANRDSQPHGIDVADIFDVEISAEITETSGVEVIGKVSELGQSDATVVYDAEAAVDIAETIISDQESDGTEPQLENSPNTADPINLVDSKRTEKTSKPFSSVSQIITTELVNVANQVEKADSLLSLATSQLTEVLTTVSRNEAKEPLATGD
ncbi:serine-rich adhesin for platelets-like [Palaemon carinicauda]|uniref:serine-rich adhesin for platelets-like n=1 Tax=Palaemon carinicauda TaxID=392227 RepID=UPI0035B66811